MGDEVGVGSGLVEEVGLVIGIDGTDGDAVDAAGQERLDDALLVGDALAGHLHFGVGVKFLGGLCDALGGDRSERTDAIGDEGDLGLLVGRGGVAAATAGDKGECGE